MNETSNPESPFYDNPKEDNIRVEDNGDLITKFLYEPNHKHYGSGDYLNFINKNFILTHTNDDEAVAMRPSMENVVILNRHLDEKSVYENTGEFEKIEDEAGNIIVKPIFVERKVVKERFEISIRNEITKLAAIAVTAAGRGGMFIKDSKTVRLEKDQTIEDKTETRPGFWAKIKKK